MLPEGVLQGMYAVNELQISYRNFFATSVCTNQGFVDFHAILNKFKDKKRQIYTNYKPILYFVLYILL